MSTRPAPLANPCSPCRRSARPQAACPLRGCVVALLPGSRCALGRRQRQALLAPRVRRFLALAAGRPRGEHACRRRGMRWVPLAGSAAPKPRRARPAAAAGFQARLQAPAAATALAPVEQRFVLVPLLPCFVSRTRNAALLQRWKRVRTVRAENSLRPHRGRVQPATGRQPTKQSLLPRQEPVDSARGTWPAGHGQLPVKPRAARRRIAQASSHGAPRPRQHAWRHRATGALKLVARRRLQPEPCRRGSPGTASVGLRVFALAAHRLARAGLARWLSARLAVEADGGGLTCPPRRCQPRHSSECTRLLACAGRKGQPSPQR